MNIDNLNKLISYLEVQPPERINMAFGVVEDQSGSWPQCGTCGCVIGHAAFIWKNGRPSSFSTDDLSATIGITFNDAWKIAYPDDWKAEKNGTRRYPAYRVIATLKRLRDTYLATGQVVVDWGPEPGEEPKTAWVAPQVAEVIAPALPAEITSLLRPSAVKTEA